VECHARGAALVRAAAAGDVELEFGVSVPWKPGVALEAALVDDDVLVACYYFGNYHPDDARKIDAAADHGIDAFIFDWYVYDDGPFLEQPIDDGFLQAKNNGRLKFAFMWANHDWIDIHPARHGGQPPLLYPGKVTPETFARIGDLLVSRYFPHPSYWRIDGKPATSRGRRASRPGGGGGARAVRDLSGARFAHGCSTKNKPLFGSSVSDPVASRMAMLPSVGSYTHSVPPG